MLDYMNVTCRYQDQHGHLKKKKMNNPGCGKVAAVKEPPIVGGSFYTHIWGFGGGISPYLGDRPGT
jgi:hypothetical protein